MLSYYSPNFEVSIKNILFLVIKIERMKLLLSEFIKLLFFK